jgi:hypothetical protein
MTKTLSKLKRSISPINRKWLAFAFSFFCFSPFLFGETIFFYHGSSTDGIKCLEPRLRYTPGEELSSPSSIYASDLPAFAAAHSFPWSSDEGIDLYVDKQTVIMEVPLSIYERLLRKTYIYVVDSNQFSLVECESTGHTFRAITPVDCLEKVSFQSVVEAIEHYGGRIVIKEHF